MLHVRKFHSGKKAYSCEVCNQEYTFMADLSKHMKTHKGEKPLSCEFCGKIFNKRGDYLRHRRSHTGEKQYECEICKKTFAGQNAQKIHMRKAHTGEKPFYCDVCGENFFTQHLLTCHKKNHSTKAGAADSTSLHKMADVAAAYIEEKSIAKKNIEKYCEEQEKQREERLAQIEKETGWNFLKIR